MQAAFEAVLERLTGLPVRVQAAGRTDAGVHALGLGVSMTLPDRWTPAQLGRALNALLPSDCFVVDVREAVAGFQARRAATERRYRYLIGTDRMSGSPFRRHHEWPLGRPLDVGRLGMAAGRILGIHDFKGFSVLRSKRPHTRCEVREAHWQLRPDDGQGVEFRIGANRFLHHMVRMLVGTMVDVALDRRPLSDMDRLLALDPSVRTSPPAPAQGLYFVTAVYTDEWFALPSGS